MENANQNPMDQLLTGIGAICEMASLMRDNLIKNGFTRQEALDIVKDFIADAFKGAAGK